MQYIDTRGKASKVTFSRVLLAGTAPGGGLYVPKMYPYPRVEMEAARHWSYPALATHVLYPYVEGAISFEYLDAITHEVYSAANFGNDQITPIEWLEKDLGLLQLSNGPTLAFKDLAMKLVARLMDYILERQDRRVVVVVSTSGDTGGAAVEAFRGLKRVELFVLFPEGRVSRMQQRMMTTATDNNVHAIAVKGSFDDCQAMTKSLFEDQGFSKKFGLSGVNSINWARIAAQVVYWVSCGVQVLNRGAKSVTVGVPSGNFGDALSAYIAREMGTPIGTIIVATNQNDVLDRFFKTGFYKKGERVLPSTSPSMDIQVASNFERLVFDITGRKGELVGNLWDEFSRTGQFDGRFLLPALSTGWASGSASEEQVQGTILRIYQKYGRIVDPHTAVGLCVSQQFGHLGGGPLVVAETAKPDKFPDAISKAIGIQLPVPEAWKHLETLPEHIHRVGLDAEEVKRFIAAQVN